MPIASAQIAGVAPATGTSPAAACISGQEKRSRRFPPRAIPEDPLPPSLMGCREKRFVIMPIIPADLRGQVKTETLRRCCPSAPRSLTRLLPCNIVTV